jgi:tetratricopeptide (TPR) repeat protein
MMKLCRLGVYGLVFGVMVMAAGAAWADPAEEAYQEGVRLAKEGLFKKGIEFLDKAIRLKPTYAEAYSARGNLHSRLVEPQRAIQDFDEAIRLNPQYVAAYYNRASASMDSGQLDKALKDYDQTVALDPANVEAKYNRGLVHLLLAHGEAAADARAYLEAKGWKEERALYVVLFGHFGYRYGHQDGDGKKLLDEAKTKCDTSLWPYPVVRYLLGELSSQALLNLAVDVDKKTEAQAYIGLDLALAGKREEAVPHFVWVKDNGNKGFVEYALAAAEFNRQAEKK